MEIGRFDRCVLAGPNGKPWTASSRDQLCHDLVALIEEIGQPYPHGWIRAIVMGRSAEHSLLPWRVGSWVHARLACFFPPGRDAGLNEVLRIPRPVEALRTTQSEWGPTA